MLLLNKLTKYIIYVFLFILIFFVLFEILARIFIKDKISILDDSFLYANYSNEELDSSKDKFTKQTGLSCINYLNYEGSAGVWHFKKGFITKKPDYDCLKKHFTPETLNVSFFGGSVMANYVSNYQNTIDWYSINFNKKIHSYNFAETGFRLSNNFASFNELIKFVKPDVAFFLDGWNEFNSIKYGGEPDEDFYWTTFYQKRIQNPWRLKIDMEIYKKLNKFYTLRLIVKLFNIRVLNESTNILNISNDKIELAAKDYLHHKNLLKIICNNYKIKCFFILQPSIHNSKNINDTYYKELLKNIDLTYPHNSKIYKLGYPILQNSSGIIDFSNLFDNQNDIFTDEVHFNKKGAEIIGKKFKEIIEVEYNNKF